MIRGVRVERDEGRSERFGEFSGIILSQIRPRRRRFRNNECSDKDDRESCVIELLMVEEGSGNRAFALVEWRRS